MTQYLGVKGTDGKIQRDVTDANGLPVKITGSGGTPQKVDADGNIYVVQAGSNPTQVTATIANGGSLSSAVDLAGKILVGYIIPAGWTAAGLTFQTSPDGVAAYNDVYDFTGTEIAHVVAASRFVRVNPGDWVGVRFIKVRSGTAAVPVNQGAVRDIILVTKAV